MLLVILVAAWFTVLLGFFLVLQRINASLSFESGEADLPPEIAEKLQRALVEFDELCSGKEYFRHSGYMGGERFIPVKRVLRTHPERVIEWAVKGMLPKNALGRSMLDKLRVYAGPEHPHHGQTPKPLEL